MDDEPLTEWAKRRDAKIGRLRAVPLVSGDGPKGAHLHPDSPRVIQRWNGCSWEPYASAANLAAAQRLLYPRDEEPPTTPASQAQPLQAGRGRHRKPGPKNQT
ncbi:hypothetical protein FB563_4158 [Streptomyces puniciscabiei]|uniref:Uncharacterized protein n=1 Tax=Streptomyces puniciscabiei TaxID=164348 RepID=A0A542UJ57_9ACTN|nr:DUF6087 family protein [Streptomyces puniciscabiei]TQK99103.1 hypothetical protein FB563_4158 [Streptomyces puniciscabiei]